MRILVVIHQFLPRHRAGSETYTYYLAKELERRGHEVTLYVTEIHPEGRQYDLTTGSCDGLPYFEAVHNHYFETFRHSYKDEAMERNFKQVLDQVRPDVIHVQHLHLHSIGYLDIAADRGIRIVYTLHEYMLMCPRIGLLLRPGLELCDGPEPEACARCARIFPSPDPDLTAELARPEPPNGPAAAIEWLRRVLGLERPNEEPASDDPYLPAVELRLREVRDGLKRVDLFIAPSAFLGDRFVANGMIAADRIVHSDYGFPVGMFEGTEPSPTDPDRLRVGFIGTIADFKGVHTVVEAFEGIEDDAITCRIHGGLDTFPDYKEKLLSMPGADRVDFKGAFEHVEIADILAGIDVLVVPSLWFENSPLTIHEAFMAKTPVLTSDRGGMAELVEDGKNGLLFRIGDAADLRAKILRLRREPELLESLRSFPEIKSAADDAAAMERYYTMVRAGERPAGKGEA